MKVLYYALFPVIAFVLNLILPVFVVIISMPITFIIIKLQNNKNMYRLRLDMIIQGILRGISLVYIMNALNIIIGIEISKWWWVIVFSGLSYITITGWKWINPFAYEFSLNVSPVIGYALGLILFVFKF